jgi:hypothetical protein
VGVGVLRDRLEREIGGNQLKQRIDCAFSAANS